MSVGRGSSSRQLTFSRAAAKSTFVTLIRLSRRASRPASVHTALMSAPDRSSFAVINSSRLTSSPSVIRDVCSLTNCKSVIEIWGATRNLPEDVTFGLYVRKGELDLSVNTTWSNQSRVQRLDFVCGQDNLDVSPRIEPIELIEKLQHGSLDLTFTT